MNEDIAMLRSLLFFLTAIVLLNAIICAALWARERESLYGRLATMWALFLVATVTQAIFQHNQLLIVLAFSTSFPGYILLGGVLARLGQTKYRVGPWLAAWLASCVLAAAASYLEFPFAAVALPVAVLMFFPLGLASVRVLRTRYPEPRFSLKFLAVAGLAQAVHLLDYPFLRDKAWFAPYGFMIAIVLIYACSVLAPVAVAEDRKRRLLLMRDEFLKVAGHELRTPLTALKMQIQMISRFLLPQAASRLTEVERIAQMFGRGERQVDRLGSLVDTLLDVTQIEEGELTLNRARVDLADIVKKIANDLAEDFRSAGCAVEIVAKGPVWGSWDPKRMEQVLRNLLGNAIKYGRGQPIRITVDAAGDTAKLSVRDLGIGLSREDRERIFERFERAAPVERFSGMGLGLYISRRIVEAHGGSVEVESLPGSGATFVVSVPVSNSLHTA